MPDNSAEPGTATYVYAVCRALDVAQLSDVGGVGSQPVRTIEEDGLTAVVSTVDLDDFGEEALRRHLEDMSWLEATARAHHGVVEAAGSVTATAPLRLATVYHDDYRVRELLRAQGEAFAKALSRVEGRTEWGVKAYADPDAFATAAAPEGAEAGAASSSGTAYLQRRRNQRRSREDAGRAATRRAEEIHAALDEAAQASRRHPPQDQRLTGHSGWMILNGAYLVDTDRAHELRALIAELDEDPSIEIELTGPWIPYSFAEPETES